MKTACILLGAGTASRFGGDKLTYPFRGEMVAGHAIRLHAGIPYDERILVTQRRHEQLISLALQNGFQVVYNDAPERGISSSIRIGISTLSEKPDFILFSVCDQPLLSRDTVEALLSTANEHPGCICVPYFGDRRGNPVVFPGSLLGELSSLTGDTGGGRVIKAHPELVIPVNRPAGHESDDIDTLRDIEILS